jgi:hypothetical protein
MSERLVPIVLTSDEDTLVQWGGCEVLDENKLGGGVHQTCGGEIDVRPISTTHKAVCCKKCYLRVPIPFGIDTYGKLRQHLAALQP